MMRKSCRRDFSLGRSRQVVRRSKSRRRLSRRQNSRRSQWWWRIDDGVAHRIHFEHSLLHDSVTTILIVKFLESLAVPRRLVGVFVYNGGQTPTQLSLPLSDMTFLPLCHHQSDHHPTTRMPYSAICPPPILSQKIRMATSWYPSFLLTFFLLSVIFCWE